MSNQTKQRTNNTSNVDASAATSNPHEIRECLITIGLSYYRPNIFNLGAMKYTGHPSWAGLVFDSANLSDPMGLIPIAQLFTNDDTTHSHDCVVRDLKDLAYQEGFGRCEIRNYFYGHSDSYETSFSGLLTGPKS